MLDVRLLIKFIDSASVSKALLIVLFLSIFAILDIWLLVFLCVTFAAFYNLILAALATVGLLGFSAIFFILKADLHEIKFMIKNGIFPEKQFNRLAGSFICAWLLISPGIITSAVGLILLAPACRTLLGKSLTRYLKSDIKEVYEYIKLYEVEF